MMFGGIKVINTKRRHTQSCGPVGQSKQSDSHSTEYNLSKVFPSHPSAAENHSRTKMRDVKAPHHFGPREKSHV